MRLSASFMPTPRTAGCEQLARQVRSRVPPYSDSYNADGLQTAAASPRQGKIASLALAKAA